MSTLSFLSNLYEVPLHISRQAEPFIVRVADGKRVRISRTKARLLETAFSADDRAAALESNVVNSASTSVTREPDPSE
jgi:hypothetical protein